MSENNLARRLKPPAEMPEHSLGWKVWLVAKTIQARLRFIVILIAVGAVIGYWDTLKAYYEKWTRPASAVPAASADAEFYCPMHPQIVREKPDQCPICGMPLSKRKKGEGEDEPLPPGVVSRVQLTPYRVASAGIQVSEVNYQPLTKEINTVGFVEFDERKQAQIAARVKSRIDRLYVNVTGQMVNKGDDLALLNVRYSPELLDRLQNLVNARGRGNREFEHMARESLRLWDISDKQMDEMLRTGKVSPQLTLRSPITGHVIRKYQVEGKYVDEGAPLYDVADLSTVWIEAQVYENELAFLKEGQVVSATTPAFPTRVFRGKVAFIHPHLDRSTRTLTVRFDMDNPEHELRPGMYATVKIAVPVTQLRLFSGGPADAGSASGRAATPAAEREAQLRQGRMLAVLETAVIDTGTRKIVYRQASPGVFEGVEVQLGPRCGIYYPVVRGLGAGDRVATTGSYLIDAETRLNPAAGSTYFGASGGPKEERRSAATARPSLAEDEDAKVKAAFAKLSPEDRRLADVQGFCPILPDNRLGAMGPPAKVMVQGQPVFLCCKGCKEKALEHPDRTLAEVEKQKARAKTSSPTNGP